VRVATDPTIPANGGCYRSLRLLAPSGSLVNARPPAAVAAGNVETSQRIADVLLGALAQAAPARVPAASQGTMNNILIGNDEFAYYETVAGGQGARPGRDGQSGIQTGMTNTQNTPIEALHRHYPFRVTAYTLRRGSGGEGRYRGGDGIRREIRFEAPATLSLLGERRRHRPWGLVGGEYLGLGVGAHSMWFEGDAVVRRENSRLTARYLDDPGLEPLAEERLDAVTHLRERVFLGLRTTAGVDLSAVSEQLDVPVPDAVRDGLRRCRERGWVDVEGERWRPTRLGMRFADGIGEAVV
jgi:N-methylhydantoinase B/oxoprolinase/acetone carboxylase alpha subunit